MFRRDLPPADEGAGAQPATSSATSGWQYTRSGPCPICQTTATFVSGHPWLRDHLRCTGCEPLGSSVPRDRALKAALDRYVPDWSQRSVHEAGTSSNALSHVLRAGARSYTASHYMPHLAPGERSEATGTQNEDIEAQTFADGSFDLVVSLDVFEHVNNPMAAWRDIGRTLTPGGYHVFTAPTYTGLITSERRAVILPDGSLEHLSEPEYHGDPVSAEGALVFTHYGYDVPDLIYEASGMETFVVRGKAPSLGIDGEFTEVYVSRKP